MHYSSIFQQLFNFIPRHRFEKSVKNLSEAMNRRDPEIFKALLEKILDRLTVLTNRIRDTLIQNLSLLEILALDRKTITKPPDGNSSEQLELFNELHC